MVDGSEHKLNLNYSNKRQANKQQVTV